MLSFKDLVKTNQNNNNKRTIKQGKIVKYGDQKQKEKRSETEKGRERKSGIERE